MRHLLDTTDLSLEEIDNMIEEGVDKLKEILASGVTLDGYDHEQLKIDLDLFTDDKK